MKKYLLYFLFIISITSIFAQKEDTVLIKDGVLSYRIFGEGEPVRTRSSK